jgi:GT2 family glycosyltransferase
VVDNGSSDGSIQRVKEAFANQLSRIVIVPLSRNCGFAVANNLGAEKTRGKYILLLNNDTEVDPSCLSELMKVMERDQTIGVAQPKILYMDKKDTFDSAGNFINMIGFGYYRGRNMKDIGQYDTSDEISYAKGAAMIIRKSLWTTLGALEPLFFIYYEETDFCWRVWLSGSRIVFIPSAKIFHVGKVTLSRFTRKFIEFQVNRNRIVMVIKNLSLRNLVIYSPLEATMYIVRFAIYARRRDVDTLMGEFKGIIWCIRSFRSLWTKRLLVQQVRAVSDEYLQKRKVLSNKPLF